MHVFGTMRLPFVILTPACVSLGVATAVTGGATSQWWQIVLVVFGAILAHVAVNVLNEYHDFRSGLDKTTKRTPFSGGSGTLVSHPESAGAVLVLGVGAATLAGAIGVFFVLAGRTALIPVGAVGILLVALYTPVIVARPVMCLLAPGLGFGSCMVLGAHVALGAQLGAAPVIASFVPFFLVSNLLLINQFPDVEPDRAVGRRNILVTSGTRTGAWVYGTFAALCYVSVAVGVAIGAFPTLALIGFVTIPLSAAAFRGALVHGDEPARLVPSLGLDVIAVLLTPVLVTIGILAG